MEYKRNESFALSICLQLWVDDRVYVCDWRKWKVEGGMLCSIDSATEPKIGH